MHEAVEADPGGETVVAVYAPGYRLGEGMLPNRDSVIQEGDILHVAMREDNAARAYQVIDSGPDES